MKLLLFLDRMILVLVAFSMAKKRLHLFTNVFNFMLLEFIITSYFSVLSINLKDWELSDCSEFVLIFYLYEVIFLPLLYIWYFYLIVTTQKHWKKSIMTIGFIGLLLGVESILVKWKVVTYIDWQSWQSILAYATILSVSYFFQRGYEHLLRREGIREL